MRRFLLARRVMKIKMSNRKAIFVIGCGIALFWLLLSMPEKAFSQEDSTVQRKLFVGTIVAPPLSMKAANGRWEGSSIEVWEAVAERMGVSFEYREYSNFGLLLDALKNGEIDVVPSLPVDERNESTMDFSQSYIRSGLAIAVPAEGVSYRWMNVVERMFSTDVLKGFGFLLLLSLIAGILVWFFEKRKNNEMFGDGTLRGIGHGIWWAIVTVTTVGYGDKAPKTIGGRTVAFIWMLFSIVFISSFTANITASLTLSELRGKVRGFNDLKTVRVGAISQTEAWNVLTRHGITVIPCEGMSEGLKAVADKKIDAFVLNEIILKYLVKNEFPGRVQVIPGTFDEYFVSMALQNKSPLRKPINKAMLKIMRTEKWNELVNRYN
jgi:polar amino acid transport system substrate-binding protein